MIRCQQIELARGGKRLLLGADLTIPDGHKVGLIGANGTGKSSLFALLRGALELDSGDIFIPANWQIAHVAQDTPALQQSALEYVIAGDQEYVALQAQIARATESGDNHSLAQLHESLANIDGYTIHARAGALLHGLGFAGDEQLRAVSSFSGGWRMRLNLAQALICRSDLLLLDEPTNHLDLDAVIWLEKWLQRYQGTLLLISHDRAFLDNIVGHIAHLERGLLTQYSGNYSQFERGRAERLAQQQAEFEKQQKTRAHLQSFIDRFRAKATKAKQAQSRIKALARLEAQAPAHINSPFAFTIPAAPSIPNPLMKLEQAQLGYSGNSVLKEINLSMLPGSRIGLLGPNGAGKSTLIKTLAEVHSPLSGDYLASPGLKVGYFAQHQTEQLQADASAMLLLQRLANQESEQKLRSYLGGFGFHGDDALMAVQNMSGGQKVRLSLALICWQKPNLLLLDEPTNHLDMEMRHALEVALQQFEGALVLVSHDRDLIATCTDELWLVAHGKVERFDGDLQDYQSWLVEQQRREATSADGEPGKREQRKDQKRREAEFRQQIRPLKNTLDKLEKKMALLGNELNELEARLADNSLYHDSNKDELTLLLENRGSKQSQHATLESDWLEVQMELEEMEEAFRGGGE